MFSSAQGFWKLLMMGIADVKTWEVTTGLVGTPYEWGRGSEPETLRRDGGNPSMGTIVSRPGN